MDKGPVYLPNRPIVAAWSLSPVRRLGDPLKDCDWVCLEKPPQEPRIGDWLVQALSEKSADAVVWPQGAGWACDARAVGQRLAMQGIFPMDAAALTSPLRWWDAYRRLLAFHWLSQASLSDRGDVFSVWHRLKFIGQEIDDAWARAKGRELAAMPQKIDAEALLAFRREAMLFLCRSSSPSRLKGSLIKNLDAFRKQTGRKALPVPRQGELEDAALADWLRQATRESMEANQFLGPVPVVCDVAMAAEKEGPHD